jgi:hypothetical protein
MSAGFRKLKAAEIVVDPHFDRFLTAFERGTTPGVPRGVVEERFRGSDGTVGEVLYEIFDAYPRIVSLDVILEDVRHAGAIEQPRIDRLEAQLEALGADLEAWESFMDGIVVG